MLVSHFNLKQDDEEEVREEMHESSPELKGTDEEVGTMIRLESKKLFKSEISIRLSLLGKTADGDGYTYLKATCTGMSLTDIAAIKCFKYLQFVDFSLNNLDLDALQPVTELPFLVSLQADKNKLLSAGLKKTKYLQILILNYNGITAVDNVYQPELSTLEVGFNQITKIHFDAQMPTLKVLDFRNNKLTDCLDLHFPNLDSLYLAGNKINSLVGIESLVNLRILHVRNNPIKLLNGFCKEHARLQYLNLRNCKVGTVIQVKKLRVLPALETLVMKGTPYMGGAGDEGAEAGADEEDSEVRLEMLAALPRLKRINKIVISPDERKEAKDLMMQWLEEGEHDEEQEPEEIGEENAPNEGQEGD